MTFKVGNYQDYLKTYDNYNTVNPYSYGKQTLSPEILKILTTYDNKSADRYGDMKKRTNLDRIFAPLLMPLHVSAGMVKGLIDPSSTVLGNAWDGFKSGNPFGQGYEKGQTTYSDVLETAGWKPDTIGGKIAKGALGLVADVFLDPSTYLTGGLSALVRGTGKAGVLASHGAETLAKLGEDVGVKVADGSVAMTKDLAEAVVKKRGLATTPEEISADAEKFASEYNRVIGLRSGNSDLTLSLGNAPFGKKIFGKYADPSLTIFKANTIENIGEKTLAPQYAKLRDVLYGTRIGKMFSTTTPLYRMSKENPSGVYDLVKSIEVERGLAGKSADVEKLIREKAKLFKDLTPAESKQILELSQDKTVWHKISQLVNLRDTKEGIDYAQKLIKSKEDTQAVIDSLAQKKSHIETLKYTNADELVGHKQVSDTLQKEYTDALNSIDLKQVKDQGQLEQIIKMHQDELTRLGGDVAKVNPLDNAVSKVEQTFNEIPHGVDHPIVKQFDEYMKQADQSQIAKSQVKNYEKLNTKVQLPDSPLVKPAVPVSESYGKRINTQLQRDGFVSFKTERGAQEFERSFPDWVRSDVTKAQKVDSSTGEILSQGGKEIQYNPPKLNLPHQTLTQPMFVEQLPSVDKPTFVENLSDHLFGDKNAISKGVFDKNLTDVVDMIRSGESKESVLNFIEENKDFYTGKSQEIFRFIAKRMGYDTWQNVYHDTIKGIRGDAYNAHAGHIAELKSQIDSFNPDQVANIKNKVTSLETSIQTRTKDITDLESKMKSMGDVTQEGVDKQINMAESTIKRMSGSDHIEELRNSLANFDLKEIETLQGHITDVSNDFKSNFDEVQNLKSQLKTEVNADQKYIINFDIKELEGVNANLTETINGLTKDLTQAQKNKLLKTQLNELDSLTFKRTTASTIGKDQIKNQVDELKRMNTLESDLIKQHQDTLKTIDKSPEELASLQKQIDDTYAKLQRGEAMPLSKDQELQIAELNQKKAERLQLMNKLFSSDNYRKTMQEIDNEAYMRMYDELTVGEVDKLRKDFIQSDSAIITANKDLRTDYNKELGSNYSKDLGQILPAKPEEFINDFLKYQQNIYPNIDPLNGNVISYVIRGVDKQGNTTSNVLSKTGLEANRKVAMKNLDEANILLNTFFVKNYSDLSDGELKLLHSLSNNNVAVLSGKEGNLIRTSQDFVVKDGGNALKAETTRRAETAHVNAVKSDVQVGTDVSVVMDGKAHAGTITKISKGKAGETVYTMTKGDGTVIDSIVPGHVMGIIPKKVTIETPVEDVVKASDVTNDFVQRQSELETLIADSKQKLGTVAETANKEKDQLLKDFTSKTDAVKSQIKDLEIKGSELDKAFADHSSQMDDLIAQVKEHESVLNNQDALETYLHANMDNADQIIKQYNPDMGSIALDTKLDVSDKVKNAVKFFRDEMLRIGQEEVGVGKLKPEQFDALMYNYLPHILTEDGAKLINTNKVQKMVASVGDKFGYGRKSYNPHGESRTITVLPDGNDGWIHNPTVEQINEYFKTYLHKPGIFSDSMHQIYTARALQHNELMYDVNYTTEMLDKFGKDYTGVKDSGHTIVMNHGKMKEASLNVSKLNVEMQISNDVSTHMSETGVIKQISDRITSANPTLDPLKRKQIVNDEVVKYIQRYVDKTFPEEVRKSMFEGHVQKFSNNTLDDLATPIIELNAKQADGINKAFGDSLETYTGFLKSKLINLKNSFNYEEFGRPLSHDEINAIKGLDLAGLKDHMFNMTAKDEIDASRLGRLFNKVKAIEEIAPVQIKQMGDPLVQRANQARKLQIAKDQSRFLQLYDKFTHIIKLNQTSVLPQFHLRNKMSNTFNNWLGVGNDAVNPEFQKQTIKAIMNKGNIEGDLKITTKDGLETTLPWSEVYAQAERHGVIDKGYFKDDLGTGVKQTGILPLPAKYDPTDTKNFVMYKKGAQIGNSIESQDRLLHFASQLSHGMSYEEATTSVNKYLFDYSDLTSFEKNVMKRIMPYYTWLRKNGALQLQTLIDQPQKYQYVAKVMSGVEGAVNSDDRINKFFVNDFALDWIQTPFTVMNPQGKEEPVLWNPNLPFMDLSRIPDITHPIDSLKALFTQSNPLFKTPIEQIMNRNVFYDQPIVGQTYDRKTKQYVLESQMKRVDNVASQLGLYGVATGLATKQGADLGLHAMNSVTGLKMLSYDYNRYKGMKIGEMVKSGDFSGDGNWLDKQESKVGDSIDRFVKSLIADKSMLPAKRSSKDNVDPASSKPFTIDFTDGTSK